MQRFCGQITDIAAAVGFEDLDVYDLARQAARMRSKFEEALLREGEKIKELKRQIMENEDAIYDLKVKMIEQEKDSAIKIEAAKPKPIKTNSHILQTDPWEPPARGVSPTLVESQLDAARREVRSQWEGRLKDSEARLVSVQEEV